MLTWNAMSLGEFLAPLSAARGRSEAPASVQFPRELATTLPHVTDDLNGESLIARFVAESEAAGAVVHRCSRADIAALVADVVTKEGGGNVACEDAAFLREAGVLDALRETPCVSSVTVWGESEKRDGAGDSGAPPAGGEPAGGGGVPEGGVPEGGDAPEGSLAAAAQSAIGITVPQAAIAETGTIVQACSPFCGRTLSLLPDVHIALVRTDAVRRHALEVLEELSGTFEDSPGRLPSQVCFITAMSCTADIELVRVEGVHGPKRVHYVLFDPD